MNYRYIHHTWLEMPQSLRPSKLELGHVVQSFAEELDLKDQIQQPDSRPVGADKPTTQQENTLGSSLQWEVFDMVEQEEVVGLKPFQVELVYYPMNTAQIKSNNFYSLASHE